MFFDVKTLQIYNFFFYLQIKNQLFILINYFFRNFATL